MKTSFITPAGMLAGNIGKKMADGTPLQPTITSHRSYRPKAVESEREAGVQCPGSGQGEALKLVH